MQDLMADTGWQAHLLRAALNGSRKIGLVIVYRRENGVTTNRLEASTDLARAVEVDRGDPDNADKARSDQLPTVVPAEAIDGGWRFRRMRHRSIDIGTQNSIIRIR